MDGAHARVPGDQNQVLLTPNGVEFAAGAVIQGYVTVTKTGFAVNVRYTASGLQVSSLGTTRRGPTYEQSGGNVHVMGPAMNGWLLEHCGWRGDKWLHRRPCGTTMMCIL